MTRTGDLAVPTFPVHVFPPAAPMGQWPWRPQFAVQLLDQEDYVWDDVDPAVVWDAPGDVYVWDSPQIAGGYRDVICDVAALTFESGEPDELVLFPPGRLEATLSNRDGRYSTWTADGRLAYWAPGRRCHVLARHAGTGEQLWLWSGRVSRWAPQADQTVIIEAFSGAAELAQDVGREWSPGTANQTPRARIAAVCTQWKHTDRVVGDAGLNSLQSVPSLRSPWEEIQVAALSDGGIVLNDADGSVYYRDRGWRVGRPDQTSVPVFSDNVCTADAVVWDLELSDDDDGLFSTVELTNEGGLVATATLPSTDPGAWHTGSEFRLTHPDPDLWQGQAVGDTLAAALLAVTSNPALAARAFTLHLTDPQQDLWRIALDRRIGDRVRLLHEQVDPDGNPGIVDVTLVTAFIRHEVTADAWTVTMSTSRAVGYDLPELWDRTGFVWDEVDDANVWSY